MSSENEAVRRTPSFDRRRRPKRRQKAREVLAHPQSTDIPLIPSKREILSRLGVRDLIPLNDLEGWTKHPAYAYLYDRLVVIRSQGLACGPLGLLPPSYPVWVKSITNLSNVKDVVQVDDLETLNSLGHKPGYFWFEAPVGAHWVVDVFFFEGRVIWSCAFRELPRGKTRATEWASDPEYAPPNRVKKWLGEYFEEYSGALQLDLVGKVITEVHLRPGDLNFLDPEPPHPLFDVLSGIYRGEDPGEKLADYEIPRLSVIPIEDQAYLRLLVKLHKKYPFRGVLLSGSQRSPRVGTLVYDTAEAARVGCRFLSRLIDVAPTSIPVVQESSPSNSQGFYGRTRPGRNPERSNESDDRRVKV